MNRRTLLATLASLPFCGWLKPSAEASFEWSETPSVFTVATFGCFDNESSIGRNAVLYSGTIPTSGGKTYRYVGFNCKRDLKCLDNVTTSDFDKVVQVGWSDDVSAYVLTSGGCWRGKD